MKKHSFILGSFLIVMLSALCSCVNEEYDLDKDIDMTVNVLKNVSVPIGSLEKVSLSDIIDFSEEEIVQTDAKGNLAIVLNGTGNVISQKVTVPDFTFEDSYRGQIVEEYLGDFYFSYDSSYGDYINLDAIKVPREFPDIPLLIEFEQTEIPSQIKDIRYAEVDATASVSLSVGINREIPVTAYIASGTELEFPEWIIIGEVAGNLKKDGSKIILEDDIAIPVSTPDNESDGISIEIPVIGVDGKKLPEGQGITSDGKFFMSDNMIIRGKSYFTFDGSLNVSGGIVSPVVTSIVSFSDLAINSIEVMLGDDIEKDLVTGLAPLVIEGLPDALTDPDIILDINDLRVDIDFSNSSPFTGTLAAQIETSAKGEILDVVNIGPVHFDAGDSSRPAEMKWSFSEGILQAPEGYVLYKVDGMTDIIKNIPEVIELKEIELVLEDDYVVVCPGESYLMEQGYSIYAPLAFGPDFKIPYTYEIKDLSLEFPAADLMSAELDIDVESTIPMDFAASAYATDDNGRVIEGLNLVIKDNAVLEAGSLDSPTLSHLKFVLTNRTGEIRIENIMINFVANAPGAELIGVPLNENQGLHFKNIVLTLPDGISADLNEM